MSEDLPYHLAIDTSSARPVVAILRGDLVLSNWCGPAGTQHNETLLHGIDECIKHAGITQQELKFLDLGIGPGMFTGLRVGVATAKFLAEAHGIRIVPVSSLLALALGNKAQQQNRIWALNDAKSKRVYALHLETSECTTEQDPHPEEEVALTPEEAAAKMQAGDYLVGEGALLYREKWPSSVLLGSSENEHSISATQIGLIGFSRWKRNLSEDPLVVQPRYLSTGQKYL